MKSLSLGLTAFLLTFITGCATTKTPAPVTAPAKPSSTTFTATGVSVGDPSDSLSMAKAEVAATTIAKANLLEKLKGSVLSNEVSVTDLKFTSQAAKLTVTGWLNRADVVIIEEEEEPSNLPKVTEDSVIVTAVASLKVTYAELNALSEHIE